MVFKNREKVILNGITDNDQKMRKDALDILTSAIKAVTIFFVTPTGGVT